MKKFPLATAIKAGLLVGLLDISAAFIQYYITTKKNPLIVAKFIASGVFGKEAAFSGADIMIFWGLVFHFTIAMCFTLFFFWLVAQIPTLLQQRLVTGIVYGAFIWMVMQFVVLPLSNTPKSPIKWEKAAIAISILMVCIGIPLAYIAKPRH